MFDIRDAEIVCEVTPRMAIGSTRPDIGITHEPGFMLVTDLPTDGASRQAYICATAQRK